MKIFSANIQDLRSLYITNLKKALDMEQKITKALPDMIEKSTDPELVTAFENHLEQTDGHVIKVEERRIVAPPTYSEMHEALRKELLQAAVQSTIKQARDQLMIRKFNVDGTPMGAVPDITPSQPLIKTEDAPPKP